MISIRHTSGNFSSRIWLQYADGGSEILGAVHCVSQPVIEGYSFRPVSEMQLSGIFSQSDDVMLTFDDDGVLLKVENHMPRQVTVKQVTAPTSIEHKGRQYATSLWSKGGKTRLYVKTPKGASLGYYDLKAGEYVEQMDGYFSSLESESEFIEKVRQAALTIQL